MSKSMKRAIRIAAIAIILIVSAGLLIKNMNIEPADYTSQIESEITEATELADGVDITKGEYTTKSIEELRSAIKAAQAVLDDSSSVYSDKRDAYNMLKEAIQKFKDSKGKLGDSEEEQKSREASSVEQSESKPAESKSESTAAQSKAGDKDADKNKNSNSAEGTSNTNSDKPASGGNTGATGGETKAPASDGKEYVTANITILCNTLVGNDALEASKKPYVPGNGVILGKTAVKVEKGKSVFDVLNKICRDRNINVSSRYTPMYGSYYVEGINHLFEFDGGPSSGWMYKVNGWFPNYGCSSYTVSEGDDIVWMYTCDLGKDVGDNSTW